MVSFLSHFQTTFSDSVSLPHILIPLSFANTHSIPLFIINIR